MALGNERKCSICAGKAEMGKEDKSLILWAGIDSISSPDRKKLYLVNSN